MNRCKAVKRDGYQCTLNQTITIYIFGTPISICGTHHENYQEWIRTIGYQAAANRLLTGEKHCANTANKPTLTTKTQSCEHSTNTVEKSSQA